VTNNSVTVDGNIVTGNGPDAAEEFAGGIVDQLTK
jgi:putative intracellular protease/amidase